METQQLHSQTKIIVYDAVIRSKLLYGLEAAQINPQYLKTLDAFQLKGLRKILKLKTTYTDIIAPTEQKAQQNTRVYEIANNHIRAIASVTNKKWNEVKPVSEVYNKRCIRLLAKIMTEQTPIQGVTINMETLKPHSPIKRRWGQPRNNWVDHTVIKLWNHFRKIPHTSLFGEYFHITLDLNSERHREALIHAATNYVI